MRIDVTPDRRVISGTCPHCIGVEGMTWQWAVATMDELKTWFEHFIVRHENCAARIKNTEVII